MIMFKIVLLFTFAFVGSRCDEDFEIPTWLPICPRNDDLDDCLLQGIRRTLPFLAQGGPEFEMPPLDPYYLDEMLLEYKRNQISAKVKVSNIYVSGLSLSTIKDVRASVDDKHFKLEVDITTPKIYVESDYKAEGRVQAIRINGKGYNNCTMHEVTYTWKISGHMKSKPDGKIYIKIDQFSMRPDVKDMHIYMSNLFPGNEELSRLGNALANQYWRLIYAELLPYVDKFWNEIGCKEANRIFQKVSVDRLFPDV